MSVITAPPRISPHWIALTRAEPNLAKMIHVWTAAVRECKDVYAAKDLTNVLNYKRIQHRRNSRGMSRMYSQMYHGTKAYYARMFTGEDLEYYEKEVG